MDDVSLKARIRNFAKDRNISASAVLQTYLLNRFLYRLSLTEYKNKFVIKGGMLIASIIGIDHRATMDLDSTLRYMKLEEESLVEAFNTISSVETDDGIRFEFNSIEPIRDDDEYGGYRLSFHAVFGKINAPMSMDISTGDVITPEAKLRLFNDSIDASTVFELMSYTVETVLAEKLETILSRGIDNTRPRDFYDIYMLAGYEYDAAVLREAFIATAKHRGSLNKITKYETILDRVYADTEMNRRWNVYSKQMPYAEGIDFSDTINVVRNMVNCVFGVE